MINFTQKIKKYIYKKFGKIFFNIESKKRRRINEENKKLFEPIKKFRDFEKILRNIKYPKNEFNKIMSMVLRDIEQFRFITKRYRNSRKRLESITHQDNFFHFLNPEAKSYPCHPLENDTRMAIDVDVRSLFVFGFILINRSLLLLKMYFPSQNNNPKSKEYKKIVNLYSWLEEAKDISPLLELFKNKFLKKFKWLNSTMRFYRNKFIEHLETGYQQGTNYSIHGDDFSLTNYKWDYNNEDNDKIEAFRIKLENRNVKILGRTSGGRDLINRYYVQKLFENITSVPYDLQLEAQKIIEETGVHSPQPEKLISEIESYIVELFNYMITNIEESDLVQYKNTN